MKSNENDFKNLEDLVTRKKEEDMLDELEKLKIQREQMRQVSDLDENIY
jgi:hypothetical protein